jgi:hypothetical protein
MITLFKSWLRVFPRPWTRTFQAELEHQNNLRTLAGVTAGALLGLGLSWLVHLISGQPPQEYMGITSIWVTPGMQPPFGSWAFIALAGVIIGFYDFEIVLYLFARLLGGKGSFGTQAYAQALFYAPLAILQQVFAVIPTAGRILFFVCAAYSLVPTTTSLKAAHGYSTVRAVITWLLPIVLNVVIVAIVIQMVVMARR